MNRSNLQDKSQVTIRMQVAVPETELINKWKWVYDSIVAWEEGRNEILRKWLKLKDSVRRAPLEKLHNFKIFRGVSPTNRSKKTFEDCQSKSTFFCPMFSDILKRIALASKVSLRLHFLLIRRWRWTEKWWIVNGRGKPKYLEAQFCLIK